MQARIKRSALFFVKVYWALCYSQAIALSSVIDAIVEVDRIPTALMDMVTLFPFFDEAKCELH